MSREIFSLIKTSTDWHELYARAINYKDGDGNYKTDYLCEFRYGGSRGLDKVI